MKNRIGILLLSFLTASASAASVEGVAKNATRETGMDAVFADYAKPGSPGCALGVFQGGRVLYEKGYGLASLEHGVAIDPRRTVFDIGSVSKQFTAASVLLLARDGKLALSDDIRKFLPEIPDYGKPITVGHLLHHTSGLRDYTVLMSMAGWDDADYTDHEDALAIISRQKAPDFASGSQFSYSNTGYFLLSAIVERVSGKRLRQFAQERIFAPLGMKDTFYLDDHRRVMPHRATSYEANPKGGFHVHMSDWMQTGDGALQTTVADLAKWQQNFDAPKVGGRGLIEQLETRGKLDDGGALGYASGLFVDEYRGLRTIGHSGAWAGYRAGLLRFPDEQLSVAVLCNLGNAQANALAQQVAAVYLEGKLSKPVEEAVEERQTVVADDAPLAEITGSYWSREGGLVRRLEQRDGKLWYVRGAQSRSELAPMGNGRLRMVGVPTRAELQMLPVDAVPQRFQLFSGDEKLVFERVQDFTPDAKTLSEFIGTYSSAELGTRWSFAIKNGKLTVKAPREEPQIIEPVFNDAFLAGRMLLRFQRNASGRVASLLVDAGRVRNLIFERSVD